MSRLRVGVIFGGKSAEHEVSLQSAKNIVDAIDKEKFEVTLLGIDKQGKWHINDASSYLLNAENPALISLNHSNKNVALILGQESQQLIAADNAAALAQLDVIFPIVHGTLGEDGSLQGLLRMANIPFVGSGVVGSAVSMDKDITKRLLRDAGLNIASFITLTRGNKDSYCFEKITEKLGLPLFIKPANQGSSVGVSKVRNAAEYEQAVALAFDFDHKVLVESAIVGREIECAVMGNDNPQASLCGEVVISDEFYSYDTKYINETGAQVIIPAAIDSAASDNIRAVALAAFRALECCGMARVDVFLTPDNHVIINEINTLPGFTNISMYPKLWRATGVGSTELITTLIELALERHQQDKSLKSSILK
ncbi:D-alanine--D-alanine ligase [Yersinia kristensenii]|uniref:D-alanine--D-alanine ligase n=1 Tax=Yersinia kristensenii TaxID=28152 RepID=UPI000C1589C7|nr:D-alanine--D-alanine ligase [Yersinia kristensenii]MDA5474195.1 D-alanine--D-alanine ligase [Yersinia kristensenii]MDA5478385.1 D-alanine--D-alanine ligase [Yersinia kristensenii]MDA5507279.1 D-alanine--D-alanine ligase [Yersinia kristensenii]MDA5523974.1 D-alanine--D-alanine ligase [Yersinia kristensenii]MDR4898991.1 D-alanine--D-alanine ligase [Yersinia kristensenii]